MLEQLCQQLQAKIETDIEAGTLTPKSRCSKLDDSRLELVLVMGTNSSSQTVHEILQIIRAANGKVKPVTGVSNSTWIITLA